MPTSPNTTTHTASPPNKPEQIRTNPNTAERPDQIGPPPESPPNAPKKTNPEHRRRPLAASHPSLPTSHSPFPNSSLPPLRGEVRWGVESREPTRQSRRATITRTGSPPNKPEQIRTNPNTAERPDQIGPPPESPPNAPKKNKPRTPSSPARPARAQACRSWSAGASLNSAQSRSSRRRSANEAAKASIVASISASLWTHETSAPMPIRSTP